MSIPQKVYRDQYVRSIIKRDEIKRKAFKSIIYDQRIDSYTRLSTTMKLAQMNRHGSITRVHDYCWATGKARAIVQPFGLCRQVFRKLALYNMIPGVKKASW